MAQRFYVGTRKGLFTIERSSAGRSTPWKITHASFIGDNIPMLLPDARDGRLYAALELGHFGSKLYGSDDGGVTWQEIGVPVIPKSEPGTEVLDPNRNVPLPARVERIWALEGGHANQPGVLWCGTIPGGLFRSHDFGATWELNQSLWREPRRRNWFGGGADWPGIHSVCVHPTDGNHVTLGVSCGGVWQSTNGGESWEVRSAGMRAEYMPPEKQFEPDIQDPHKVVQCKAKPEHLWAQHHNGIFRSTDGAASWKEIEDVKPSRFGFAVAVHPTRPETAWFIPAIKDEKRIPVEGKVVVTRTRDGGNSFQELRRGLPQEHAYDLVFRHGLDIDSTGDCLAFGSTTGSVWVSEDQGDSWHHVTAHLPPVYCVRFAA